MTDVIPDLADPRPAYRPSIPAYLTAPPLETECPARQTGEIFKRLSGCHAAFGEAAFARIVHAVLVALGRAAMIEAEAQARRLAERTAPAGPGTRVTAVARRLGDFDGWDPGDPE